MKYIAAITLLTATSAFLVSPSIGQAADATDEAIRKLQDQIKNLTEEVQRLKAGAPSKEEDDLSGLKGDSTNPKGRRGLTIGFYGEAKYRIPEAGRHVFDPHRFVFLPGYEIADWLIFGSEFEVEHGGIDESTGARSRFNGEIEIEQFWVDILINEHFNIRSLGLDLVPVSRFNKHHEPTTFYSTERPELYREIIPSTWFEPSMSIHGKVVEGLDYQFMVSSGMEDEISGTAGVTASNGFRDARPRLRQTSDYSLAYSGRLRYSGIPGLDTSVSFYTTELVGTGRAHSQVWLGHFDALYRVPKTGLELRGDVGYWHIENPSALVANNNASLTDNVGDRMYGWSAEAAYHFWPEAWRDGKGKDMDLVPFIRYTDIVTQSSLESGSELDNGTANKDFLTLGLAWFLNQNFVIKADYRRNLNGSTVTETSATNQDYFQFGVGMLF